MKNYAILLKSAVNFLNVFSNLMNYLPNQCPVLHHKLNAPPHNSFQRL
ncbi:hypothetical protein BV140_664 [Haemophilus influenzae]|uniref:Uncharacterized protein n=1 Tax=Haemophilus influenzae TaxID=727 RepID=A0A158SZ73_HAEIF|nr:hypothetical protein H733_0371 [Haemophilus influenzae CGSHiCZ412602]AVI95663.1 hypothetical protein BV083_604 [Haemophilus influenzae]AVI97436.1 hypothetical protein BV085_602 [Haemophilus influenzae]AVI99205.1 hypothetical protein BV121_584 [Haemophilus influenzae]AVJ01053.1 hypothetical protein BV122_586 [Haemophilus influenzae]